MNKSLILMACAVLLCRGLAQEQVTPNHAGYSATLAGIDLKFESLKGLNAERSRLYGSSAGRYLKNENGSWSVYPVKQGGSQNELRGDLSAPVSGNMLNSFSLDPLPPTGNSAEVPWSLRDFEPKDPFVKGTILTVVVEGPENVDLIPSPQEKLPTLSLVDSFGKELPIKIDILAPSPTNLKSNRDILTIVSPAIPGKGSTYVKLKGTLPVCSSKKGEKAAANIHIPIDIIANLGCVKPAANAAPLAPAVANEEEDAAAVNTDISRVSLAGIGVQYAECNQGYYKITADSFSVPVNPHAPLDATKAGLSIHLACQIPSGRIIAPSSITPSYRLIDSTGKPLEVTDYDFAYKTDVDNPTCVYFMAMYSKDLPSESSSFVQVKGEISVPSAASVVTTPEKTLPVAKGEELTVDGITYTVKEAEFVRKNNNNKRKYRLVLSCSTPDSLRFDRAHFSPADEIDYSFADYARRVNVTEENGTQTCDYVYETAKMPEELHIRTTYYKDYKVEKIPFDFKVDLGGVTAQ